MRGVIRLLAKRRFNYMDAIQFSFTGGLISQDQYLAALAVFVVGTLVSAIVEVLAR